MSLKKKEPTLANQIGDLLTAVPKSYGSDDEFEEAKAKVVDYDDEIDALSNFKREYNSSSIRTRNLNLLEESDERYKGRKVSKKEIFHEDDSSDESSDDDVHDSTDESSREGNETDDEQDDVSLQESADVSDNEDDDMSLRSSEKESDNEESYKSLRISESKLNKEKDNNTESSSQDDDDEELDYKDDVNPSSHASSSLPQGRTAEGGIRTMTAINFRGEVEKANCVKEQLRIWENLLEMRIRLQKFLINSNQMPQYDVYKVLETNDEFKSKCTEVKTNVSELLNNLLQLQSNLVNNFPETKDLLAKGKKRKIATEKSRSNDDSMDEEIPSDTDEQSNSDEESEEELRTAKEETSRTKAKTPARKIIKIADFEDLIDRNYKAYSDYRDSTIQKWNDKTRIASGIISKKANQPVLKQIEFILSNRDKLVKKTQLKRSQYDIIGKSPDTLENEEEEEGGNRLQEYDTEIYDDDDFYHQLLRDLIEFKSSDITDPIQLSKQWVQLQNMRSKMKRKVDTKATKGRRIRYEVHEKLVNLMAPITVFDTWTDRAKDDLYSSLFGKTRLNREQTSAQ